MRVSQKSAFSLIELLVALSILAVVAAIVVPRFLDIQRQAKDTVAAQMASQLNHTYAEWIASGGSVGGNVATADLLTVLTSDGQISVPSHDGYGAVSDGGTSQNIRIATNSELATALASTLNSNTVPYQDSYIFFDNTTQQFSTISQSSLEAINWSGFLTNFTVPNGTPMSYNGAPFIINAPTSPSSGTVVVYGYGGNNQWGKLTYNYTWNAGSATIVASFYSN